MITKFAVVANLRSGGRFFVANRRLSDTSLTDKRRKAHKYDTAEDAEGFCLRLHERMEHDPKHSWIVHEGVSFFEPVALRCR